MEDLYFNIMLAASCSLAVTGLILMIVKNPSDVKAAKFKKAKIALNISVFILAVLNFVQIGFDPEGDIHYLGGVIALCVSYLQAMLLTVAVIVLVNPEEIRWRRLCYHLGLIGIIDTMLLVTFFLLPLSVFFFFYELGILLYVIMLVHYTRWYIHSYRRFMKKILDYYEEEEIERGLRWVNIIFWAALSVGVLSLLMLFGNREIDMALTLSLAIFYAVLSAFFINYELSTPIILPALAVKTENGDVGQQEDVHPDKLMAWIEKGGYLNTRLAVEEIAAELDMNVAQFRSYFNKVIGEDFRTWRVRKRIEHARTLISAHPDWSVKQIAQESGFNDRSYFYQQFQVCTGMSLSAYRKKVECV